ncbi:MAG: 3-deoxy-D-manno-octulosonic acid transferase, partial [Planctomycetota bacterium]
QSQNPCFWLHAVSVGEVVLLKPIIDRLRHKHPDACFAISTSTETGFDLATDRFPDDLVFFAPVDFTWAVRRVILRIRPTILVLAELEIWPNLIRETSQQGIPIVIFNGRLSEKSHRGYRRLSWLIRPLMQRLTLVLAQTQTYANRFVDIGCDICKVSVTGNVKFDNAETNKKNPQTAMLAKLARLSESDFVFVAGSTQLQEDLMAARAFRQFQNQVPDSRLILVPRHPERTESLGKKLNQMGFEYTLRSQLTTPFESQNLILIVDVIGELKGWWGCADAAYVGGSLDGQRGGQNMLEPCAFGIPVCFGPHTQNFQEIVDSLLASDAATVIKNEAMLLSFLHRATCPQWSKSNGRAGQNVVLSHVGGADRTVHAISQICHRSVEPLTGKPIRRAG